MLQTLAGSDQSPAVSGVLLTPAVGVAVGAAGDAVAVSVTSPLFIVPCSRDLIKCVHVTLSYY